MTQARTRGEIDRPGCRQRALPCPRGALAAVVVGLIGFLFSASAAFAQCTITNPLPGQSVTCSGFIPIGVNGIASNNVTVLLDPTSDLVVTPGQPIAIQIGEAGTIVNNGYVEDDIPLGGVALSAGINAMTSTIINNGSVIINSR